MREFSITLMVLGWTIGGSVMLDDVPSTDRLLAGIVLLGLGGAFFMRMGR